MVLEHYRGKADRDLAQAGAPIYLEQLLKATVGLASAGWVHQRGLVT